MVMTADDFKASLTRLGLKTQDVARVLQIDRTTAFRYASGRLPVPRKGTCLDRFGGPTGTGLCAHALSRQ